MIRPWRGISGQTVTRGVASYYDSSIDRGVLVTRVILGGPADNSGIAAGDVILEFDGKPTNDIEGLTEIQKRELGEEVEILILQDTGRCIIEAVLENTP